MAPSNGPGTLASPAGDGRVPHANRGAAPGGPPPPPAQGAPVPHAHGAPAPRADGAPTAHASGAPTLPRPGLLGRAIRLALGLLLLQLLWIVVTVWQPWYRALPWSDWGFIATLLFLLFFAATTVNELFAVRWGWWPSVVLALLLGAAAALDAFALDGWHLLGWAITVAALPLLSLMGTAFLLAAVIGTPGCEMRAYAHLAARVSGGDAAAVVCSGWIDRFDRVRILGRF